MKITKAMFRHTAACAAVLTMAAVPLAKADQAEPDARPAQEYTGTVVSVDQHDLMLTAKGFLLSRQFNLGASCRYVLLDKTAGAVGDLRPGEKVMITYQNVNGVLVANEVKQVPLRYTGMVNAIDPAAHTLQLHEHGFNKKFQIADDCAVTLRDDKSGALGDIQIGDHVTVTYETPEGKMMARQIAQTSLEFNGTLTAIDLGERTLKAKDLFSSKKFNVANDCAIVINGKPDGHFRDLKPEEHLVISYDEIDGVNVVNRIAPAETGSNPVTTSTSPVAGS